MALKRPRVKRSSSQPWSIIVLICGLKTSWNSDDIARMQHLIVILPLQYFRQIADVGTLIAVQFVEFDNATHIVMTERA